MKTRLLRKLRLKFRITKDTGGTWYINVNGWYGFEFDNLKEAREERRDLILQEARLNYSKYSVIRTKTFD